MLSTVVSASCFLYNKKYFGVVLSLAFETSTLLLPATNVFAASKWKAPSHKWTAPAPTTLTVYSVEPAATPWTTVYEIVM
jgi:hypothetical protein